MGNFWKFKLCLVNLFILQGFWFGCATEKRCRPLYYNVWANRQDVSNDWDQYADYLIYCNFNDNNKPFCDWKQSYGETDNGDWIRAKFCTPTHGTGPNGDFPDGLGYYLYQEASNFIPGDKVRLDSRLLAINGAICVDFWYNMYGSEDENHLNIIVKDDTTSYVVWQRTGQQSSDWLYGSVTFTAPRETDIQVTFEAVRGLTEFGDIAIDNIGVKRGACGTKPTEIPNSTIPTTSPTTSKPTSAPGISGGTCSGYGDPHYFTFDNYPHTFMGNCTYTLSKLCDVGSSLPYFNIEVEHEYREGNTRVSYVKEVTVYVHSYKVSLGKQKMVKVNGLVQRLPLSLSPDVYIGFSGQYVVVTAAFGLKVKYDGDHRVEVTLSKAFQNKVCGICANYNLNKNDDNLNRAGQEETDSVSYGNSWQVGSNASCSPASVIPRPNCSKEEIDVIQSNVSCAMMLPLDGVFQHCHMIVDPREYFVNCFHDLCELHLAPDILCNHLQAYTDACHAAGAQVLPWRNSTFCPLKCPPHSHYEQCGTACPETCVNPMSPSSCSLPCTEGCICDAGYMLYHDKCVPDDQCGCWEDGKHHPIGSEFWTDDSCSTKCRCPSAGGNLVCNSASCPPEQYCGVEYGVPGCYPHTFGECTIYGDPHYNTFDKEIHHFMGTCTYTLSKTCNYTGSLPYFNVEAKNEHRGNPTVSWIKSVTVEVYNYTITMVKNEPSKVLVNGVLSNLPVLLFNRENSSTSFVHVSRSGRHILLETDFYLKVSYDTDHTVSVMVSSYYHNMTCGMCGNFNGIRHDDFLMPNGQLAQNSNQLGDSWQVEDDDPSCNTITPTPPPPCPPENEELYGSDAFCGLIKNKHGPFQACISVINPDRFFDSCVYDLCALGNETLCKSIEAYADACQRAQVVIAWRNSTFCPIECPTNSHYNACASACPITCLDQNAPSNCNKPCAEACECDDGFVLSGSTCVPVSDCGCNYEGRYYQKDETFWEGECERHCHCVGNNQVNCIEKSCAPNEICKVHNGVKTCIAANTATCHIYGDPHYITFDGKLYHFQGACNYTVVETCGNSSSVKFSVTTRNEHRGSLTWTAINSVAVRIKDLHIILGKNRVVEINGVVMILPVNSIPGILIELSGSFVILQAKFGLEVKFNGDHELFVKVNENFKDQLCGLCGTYNGNELDDFLTPGGLIVSSSNDFGKSWRVPDDDWVCEDDVVEPPPCEPASEIKYKEKCRIILSGSGPFKDCHNFIQPQLYFENCVYDLCATGGNEDQFCDAIGAYAAACESAGVTVGDWREDTMCHACDLNCTFDVNLCNWKQSKNDDMDWIRWRGPTPSTSTGPSFDHTTGNGYYLYIDGRNSLQTNIARLESPDYCLKGKNCFRFWYHMYGAADYMQLRVSVYTAHGLESECNLMGNAGDLWRLKEIFLPDKGITKIFFEGIRGEHYRSDVAIDDISVVPGDCTGTPPNTTPTTTTPTPTVTPPSGSCEVSGDPHYYTFDNQVHHFMGICTYILSKLCEHDGQLVDFNVEAANEHRGGNTRVSYVKYVNVDVHGRRITLEKDKVVKVNGDTVTLPKALNPGINIFLSGHDVLVTTAFGLNVKFDGNHRVVVTIPHGYANKVCGLCGNFNGNQTDDFLNPDGELEPDSNSLGNSWQVDNDTRCTTGPVQPNCTDDEKDTIASNSNCGIISDKNGPFRNCHSTVDPVVYFNNCAYDLCELNLEPGTLCDSLQSYAQACQSHGITTHPWRNETFCPLKCPPNSHYEHCSTACPATCVNPTSPSTCSLPCTEGCACDAGYVLYNKMCVPKDQCGCWEDGKHYPVGPDFWTDDTCTRKCRCPSAGGSLICESASCPYGKYCGIVNGKPDCIPLSFSNCVVYGDPHYNTFDQQTHHFMGICTYTISKLCSNSTSLPYFNIEGKNEHRGNPTVSWIQRVMVEVYNYKTTMVKDEPGRVLVNGVWTNLPVSLVNGSLVVTRSGRYVILETDFHLAVSYDTDHTVDVKLPIHYYYNKTCGMCGNLNNNPHDDFLMPNGQFAQNSNQLGDSWQVEDDDPLCNPVTPTPTPCPPENEELYRSDAFCGLLTNKRGPFLACHSVINPDRFFDSCVYDLCALGNGTLCKAIEAYADACQRAGVVIAWRNTTFCPIPCPDNSHYNVCTSACPATCLDQNAPDNCNRPCTDACECNDGFVLSGSSCVPVSECGCLYDGKYYQKNEIFWRGECVSLCKCVGNNHVNCTDQSCPPNEICQVQDGVKTCVPEVTTTTAATPTKPTPTPDACDLNCTFDVNLCNWKQSKNDDMDWIRWRGPTPSTSTGPSFDHTTGNGYYLYIDGRNSLQTNIARLESPNYCLKGKNCFRFWYHMYGAADYMQLRVSVYTAHGLESECNLMGNAGDLWRLKEIFLPDKGITKIFFEGIRGEHYRSDVAIDDISVVPGDCTGTPPNTTPTTTTPTPTVTPPSGSCEVSGDPHYYTFDNQVHHFMGICTYTLSKLCEHDGQMVDFNVEAANEHRGGNTRVSYVKYVNVDVHGHRITLEKDKVVKVNGDTVTLPKALNPGLNIFLSGHDVLVTTAFGLNVKFDGNHRVVVTIPHGYANKVCGLCGNFNGNQTDDFLNPDGKLEPDSNSLGNSWQVDNDTRCTTGPVQPNCTDEEKDTIASNSYCGIISDKNGPFRNCHTTVDPVVYFNNCAYDLCELNLDPGTLCDSLQSYAQACQSHGITIHPWRNETFCPLKCPPNSHYEHCSTACPATCVNPTSPSTCSLPCTEGCACDAGYVLYNKMCVPKDQCGCWEDGKHYPVGPDFWTDDTCTKKCRCPSAGGSLICESASCPYGKYCGIVNGKPDCIPLSFSNCVVYGDPHYNTFDQQTHHFMGICTYTISKLCSNSTSLPYFNIEGKNEHRGNPTVSWIQRVMVEVYNYKTTMVKDEPGRVLVNGVWTNLPVSLVNGSLVVTRSGRYVILETDFHLAVSYDTDHTVDVKLPIHYYYNKTCGMCGNLNNNPHDDFLMPNGQLAQNSNQLGDSWQVEDDDPLCNPVTPTPTPCPPDNEELYRSDAFCGLLTNKRGPFQACHSVINPDRFFDSCVYDLCALGNVTLCKAIEAYADACQRAGVVIAWRNSTFCPIPCPDNSHYNVCTSACPATCLDQNAPDNCNRPCTDACECNDGFVLSGSSCVPVSECGCLYDGKYYQKNEIFWRGECVSRCTCVGSNLVNCTDQSCPPNEICQVQDGVKTCVPKVTTTTAATPTKPTATPDACDLNCTFDVNFCNWKQAKDDDMDWIRWRGATPSSLTGPSFDHTTGNGYYLYIDGSSSRPENIARLESPDICYTGKHCLRFWYHMYGAADKMQLRVSALREDGLEVMFDIKGNAGDVWHLEEIFLLDSDFIKIFIEGITGEDIRSDVAIDDISFIPGYCPGKPTTTPATIATTTTPVTTSPPEGPSGSCEVSGDPHYYTFDNQVHHFMGICTYTLSKLCEHDGQLTDFNVEAANEHRGGNTRVSYVKYVNVDVHGHRITLEKDKVVKVNGDTVTLPKALNPGINIFLSGHDVLVTTTFGLNVKFDGNHRVVVTIPHEYANKVCGLCGNFNRNQTDDFLNPDGELEPDSNSLGNSWQVDNDTMCIPGPDIQPECTDNDKITIASNSFCGMITDKNGPFKDCHDVVDPLVYFNNCLYDLCELNLDPGALCDNLQSYVQSCQSNNVLIRPWRNETFCPLKCPPNSQFEPCGTACPATCVNPASPSNCNLPCTESCICDPGYVLHNQKCVPSLQCGCWDNDRHYPVGSEFWKDDTCSTKCKCPSPGSSLVCKNDECPSNQYCSVINGNPVCAYYTYGACRVHNDPHYESFDKQTHHFMGLCTYTLSKLCSNSSSLPYFNVEAKNEHRGNPSVSYVQRVLVEVYGNRIQIIRNEKSRVLVNDTLKTLPVILNGGAVKVDLSGRYIVVDTDFKLKVAYDADHSVEVKLPDVFSEEVCGMCGNFNNRRPDDFLMPNGQMAQNSNQLGNSWIVYDKDDPHCMDKPTPAPPITCPPDKENLYESDTFCGLLTSKDGLFSTCHSKVDPESFFESCVFDLCALDGDKNVLCSALEAYADACQKLGVTISNWRNITSCGGPACQTNSQYNECMTACPATCLDPHAPEKCTSPCVEGCECKDGYILSGGICISKSQCGCWYNEQYYNIGDEFIEGNCERRCWCQENNNVFCSPMSCPGDEICKVQDGLLGCYQPSTAICHIYGDPHYSTFDGTLHHFQGACNYTVSETCANTSHSFSVTTRNEHRGNPSWTAINSVALTVDGVNIFIEKNNIVHVNNVVVPLPTNVSGIIIIRSGQYVVVNTNFGLQIKFNGDHELFVNVNEKYKDLLCGLCGTYNDNPLDDFMIPDGSIATDVNDFGNSWRVPDDGWPCNSTLLPPPPCLPNIQQEAEAKCEIIKLLNGPFAQCHTLIPPNQYFESCVYDQCATEGDDDYFCSSLEFYAAACEAMGVSLGDWRKDANCEAVTSPSPPNTTPTITNATTSPNVFTTTSAETVTTSAVPSTPEVGTSPSPPNTTPVTNATTSPNAFTTTSAETPTTSAEPSTPDICNLNCSFDTGFCNWKQSKMDHMDWIRWQGSTPSDFTGPSFDHTTGNGYYLYIDGANSKEGDTATLESPANCFTGKHCLHFWYHMYGAAQNMKLIVSALRADGLEHMTFLEGNAGDEWRLEQIFLPDSDIIQIFIDGITGDDYRSDVAIDDISLIHGYCFDEQLSTTSTIKQSTASGFTTPFETSSYSTSTLTHTSTTSTTMKPTATSISTSSSNPTSTTHIPPTATSSTTVPPTSTSTTQSIPISTTVLPIPTSSTTIPSTTTSSTTVLSTSMLTSTFSTTPASNTSPTTSTSTTVIPSTSPSTTNLPPTHTITSTMQSTLTTSITPTATSTTSASSSSTSTTTVPPSPIVTITSQSTPSATTEIPIRTTSTTASTSPTSTTTIPSSPISSTTIPSTSTFTPPPPTSTTLSSNGIGTHATSSQETPTVSTVKPSSTATSIITTQTIVSTTIDKCNMDCSFDTDYCNWKQSKTDTIDWIRWKGATPSDLTGPSFDHTTGDGYYLYINGQQSKEKDVAILESPVNCFTGKHCLQFWYHMYGDAQEMMIKVAVLRADGLEYMTYLEGNAGDVWRLEQIFLPDSEINQIFIEGVRGENDRSDVAIDDISLIPGYCVEATTTTTTIVETSTPPGFTTPIETSSSSTSAVTHTSSTSTTMKPISTSISTSSSTPTSTTNISPTTIVQPTLTSTSNIQSTPIPTTAILIPTSSTTIPSTTTSSTTVLSTSMSTSSSSTTPASSTSPTTPASTTVIPSTSTTNLPSTHTITSTMQSTLTTSITPTAITTTSASSSSTSTTTIPPSPVVTITSQSTPSSTTEIPPRTTSTTASTSPTSTTTIIPSSPISSTTTPSTSTFTPPPTPPTSTAVSSSGTSTHSTTIQETPTVSTVKPSSAEPKCPPNSHYEHCGTACPATCVNPEAPSNCSLPCTESCICDKGYVLSDNRCVPNDTCKGCWDDDQYYPLGPEFWTDDTCSTKCQCLSAGSSLACKNDKCPSNQYCGISNGKPGCHYFTYGVCRVHNDPHYDTFDRLNHDFMGLCTYTLAKLCNSSSEKYFNIEAKNEHRGDPTVSYVRHVLIEVYGYKVQIMKTERDRVLVNKVWTTLPVTLVGGAVTVRWTGKYVSLQTDFKLTVSYDVDTSVEVKLPSNFSSLTCGMCGNFNGEKPDDFMMPNGQQAANTEQLGQSWIVEDDDPLCNPDDPEPSPPPSCTPESYKLYKSDAFCGLLISKDGPFHVCNSVISPGGVFESCIFDMCALNGDPETLCSLLSVYADACQKEGISISWRNSTFCPADCPINSHFSTCASACSATCVDPHPTGNCSLPCSEGCECDAGYVISGGTCVPESHCGCLNDGIYYKEGEQFIQGNCESQCTCLGNNNLTCLSMSCAEDEICKVQDGLLGCYQPSTAICHIYGDPHYSTFDGTLHHFQGACTYTVSETCANTSHSFSVTTRNEHRGNPSWTAINSVTLTVNEKEIYIGKNNIVHVNNATVTLPANVSGIIVTQKGQYVTVSTTFGLELQFNGDHELFVRVKEYYKGALCGLCGTYNDNHHDDFMTPNGSIVTDVNDFGNSWRVPDDGWPCNSTPPPPPVCPPPIQQEAEKKCWIIRQSSGAFKPCHAVLRPHEYYESCVFDQCVTGGSDDLLCSVLQSYATACEALGVSLDWINNTICGSLTTPTTPATPATTPATPATTPTTPATTPTTPATPATTLTTPETPATTPTTPATPATTPTTPATPATTLTTPATTSTTPATPATTRTTLATPANTPTTLATPATTSTTLATPANTPTTLATPANTPTTLATPATSPTTLATPATTPTTLATPATTSTTPATPATTPTTLATPANTPTTLATPATTPTTLATPANTPTTLATAATTPTTLATPATTPTTLATPATTPTTPATLATTPTTTATTSMPTTTTTTTTSPTTPEIISSSICSASGDPHYNTFDGAVHHYMGNCSYTLTKLCNVLSSDFSYFHVYSTNEHRGANTKVSYVQSVHIEVYNTNFTLLKNKKLNVNGKRTNLPTPPDNNVRVHISGNYLILETNFGLQVRFDGNQYTDVSLPATFKDRVCGLCGNYNGNEKDDNLKRDGSPTSSSKDLGDSWLVGQDDKVCHSQDVENEDCDPNLKVEYSKNTACGIITDTSGIFKDCHALVKPNHFFDNCVMDMCFTGGESISLCYALQAYAQQCLHAGKCVEWRSDTFCPISCPARSNYKSCGSSCPTTCFNSPTLCSAQPVEGCFCNDSYVLSGDRCVPESECGCTDENKNSYQVGESWFTDENCTERWTCNSDHTITSEKWQCGVQEKCQRQDGVLGCQSSGIAACHVYGDPHFYTFDKKMHSFMGTCTYVLVEVSGTNLIPFSIKGKTENRGLSAATYLKEVYIDIYNIRITLQKDRRTLVGNTRIQTPWSGNMKGVSIGNVGLYTVVTTDFGMIVKFDGDDQLEIVLPNAYFDKVRGMCGNFNGNINDELLMANGQQAANVTQFGNSWKSEKDSDKNCMDDTRVDLSPPCANSQLANIQNQCDVLLTDPFKACHDVVPPGPFSQTCVYDMCRYNGMLSTLCTIVQAYVDACRTQGVHINWRNPYFCPLACPTNSHYTNCASLCPSTCTNIYAPDVCEKPTTCMEGCVCNNGYVLSGDQCVPLKSCGCRDTNDDYYNVDESWITPRCTQKCQCVKANEIKCKPFSCPYGDCSVNKNGNYICKPTGYAKCTITGDPHYRTFDELSHHFQGKQTYIVTRTAPSLPDYMEPFKIEGKNEAMYLFSKYSLLKELNIEVYDHIISFKQNKKLVLDGVRTSTPVRPHEGINIYQRASRIYMETDFGLSISFDGRENGEITMPNTYKEMLQGLCGNFDGRRNNDFTNPEGRILGDVGSFGESWNIKSLKSKSRFRRDSLVALEEEDIILDTGENFACSASGLAFVNSSSFCGIMRDTNGPFKNCTAFVSPEDFIVDCIFDTCAEFQSKDLLCSNLEQYAIACQENNIVIDGWREVIGCVMSCNSNSFYNKSMNACPASCSDMASESECEAPSTEGCQCEQGYVLSGTDCVPYKDCGGTFLRKYYQKGETFVTDDCSQNCTCTGPSSFICDDMHCAQEETCTTANQIQGCYIPSPCLENPCENGGTCVEVPGSGNDTSGFRCLCPDTHTGTFCEDENEVSFPAYSVTAYIVIGVVVGVFVLGMVFIVTIYCYRKSRKGKSRIFDLTDSSEDGRDRISVGSINMAYNEPQIQQNLAFNENLGENVVHETHAKENVKVNTKNEEPGTQVNLGFEDDHTNNRHVNETDEETIF